MRLEDRISLMGYKTEELNERVPGVSPDLITRFKGRAEWRAKKLNERRSAPTYRWIVCDWLNGKWAVVAMQNRAVPK